MAMCIVHRDTPPAPESPCPILDLPDDVACAIIATMAQTEPPGCLIREGYKSYSRYPRIGRTAALGFLRLSEVCRRFRALLLSMPELWGSVVCLLPEDRAELALSRARSAPLTAYICDMLEWVSRENVYAVRDVGRKRLLALVVAHAARVRTLTAHDLRPEQLAQLFSGTLPLLEDIELRHGAMSMPNGPAAISVDAPNLRHAALNISFNANNGAKFSFKLPSLRSLQIVTLTRSSNDSSKFNWIRGLLESSPLIEHVEFSLLTGDGVTNWTGAFGGHRIQLTHLRSLVLEGTVWADLLGLYAHIRPNHFVCVRMMLLLIDSWGVAAEEATSDVLKTCGSLLQRQSYDGLLVRISRTFEVPCMEVATYPSVAELGQASKLGDVAKYKLESMHLGMPFPVDTESSIGRQITDVVSKAVEHNHTRQLIINTGKYGSEPTVQALVTRICEAVGRLGHEHDGESGSPLQAINCPSPSTFIDSMGIWDARWDSPRTGEPEEDKD